MLLGRAAWIDADYDDAFHPSVHGYAAHNVGDGGAGQLWQTFPARAQHLVGPFHFDLGGFGGAAAQIFELDLFADGDEPTSLRPSPCTSPFFKANESAHLIHKILGGRATRLR